MANRFYIRKFFNRPGYHSTGFIYAYVAKSTKKQRQGGGGYVSCDLTIGDCSRQISLDFDHYSKKDRANSLYKLDTIIESLTKFREALNTEYELIEEAQEEQARKDAEALDRGEEINVAPYVYDPPVRKSELTDVLTSEEFLTKLRDAIKD